MDAASESADSGAQEERRLPKARRRRGKIGARDNLCYQLRAYRFPEFVVEHRFAKHIGRRWRFDIAWPEPKIAIEVEGLVVRTMYERNASGVYVRRLVVTGRHATIQGFTDDAIKYAHAAAYGWTVLRFNQALISSRQAVQLTVRVFLERGISLGRDSREVPF